MNQNLNNLNRLSKYILVGDIVNTHGIKGDFKVSLKPSNFLINVNNVKKSYVELDGKKIYMEMERISKHKNIYLFKSKEFNNINDVEIFKGHSLYSEIDIKPDQYFFYELIGMDIFHNKKLIGKVEDYFLQGAFYSLIIEGNEDLTIPISNNFIDNINKEDNLINVIFPEGYLNE